MRTLVINKFTDFDQLYLSIRNDELEADIDVSGYKFFNPKEILILTQYFVVQNKKNIDGCLIADNKNGWYFGGIKLEDFCNTNYHAPADQKQSFPTAIPIRRIDVSTMNAYIDHALKFFSGYCIGKDIAILSVCISEIINNVNDHSESEHDAYIFCQHYPKQNRIKFAISDLGVGIPKTVNDYLLLNGMTELKNVDALDWAIQKGKSAKSQKHNKGLGLYNIISFLKDTGTLEIYSENVYCSLDWFGNIRFKPNPIRNFKGTLISIDININTLEPFDETILEDYTF